MAQQADCGCLLQMWKCWAWFDVIRLIAYYQSAYYQSGSTWLGRRSTDPMTSTLLPVCDRDWFAASFFAPVVMIGPPRPIGSRANIPTSLNDDWMWQHMFTLVSIRKRLKPLRGTYFPHGKLWTTVWPYQQLRNSAHQDEEHRKKDQSVGPFESRTSNFCATWRPPKWWQFQLWWPNLGSLYNPLQCGNFQTWYSLRCSTCDEGRCIKS